MSLLVCWETFKVQLNMGGYDKMLQWIGLERCIAASLVEEILTTEKI